MDGMRRDEGIASRQIPFVKGKSMLNRLYEKYNSIEKTIAGCIMLVLIFTGFAQVILRFVFKAPLAWAEELIIFCSIWSVYIGSSAAANEGKHVMVAMLVDHLPRIPQMIVKVFSQLLWFGCCIALTITGWQSAYDSFLRGSKTLGGGFPYWTAMIAVPIGMALMSVRVIISIYKTIRGESDTPSVEESVLAEIKDDMV